MNKGFFRQDLNKLCRDEQRSFQTRFKQVVQRWTKHFVFLCRLVHLCLNPLQGFCFALHSCLSLSKSTCRAFVFFCNLVHLCRKNSARGLCFPLQSCSSLSKSTCWGFQTKFKQTLQRWTKRFVFLCRLVYLCPNPLAGAFRQDLNKLFRDEQSILFSFADLFIFV